eukprot:210813-Pelagomonas_calceolata.AAC.3
MLSQHNCRRGCWKSDVEVVDWCALVCGRFGNCCFGTWSSVNMSVGEAAGRVMWQLWTGVVLCVVAL